MGFADRSRPAAARFLAAAVLAAVVLLVPGGSLASSGSSPETARPGLAPANPATGQSPRWLAARQLRTMPGHGVLRIPHLPVIPAGVPVVVAVLICLGTVIAAGRRIPSLAQGDLPGPRAPPRTA